MASPSDSTGTFGIIGNPLQCAGNAIRWNVCYYPTAGSTSSSATLVVYRKKTDTSRGPVSGSLMTVTVPGSTNSNYACTSFPISAPFSVLQGDIITACIPTSNGLKMAAVVIGASVNHVSGQHCGVTGSLSPYRAYNLTALVSLGM